MATHASVCGALTASVLSASSLGSTRLVRSLGNLHVVAGERDPVFCEQWGSRRDRGSPASNTDTRNSLNMAHLQASSPLPRSEPFGGCTCIELDPFFLVVFFFLQQMSSTLEKSNLNGFFFSSGGDLLE